MAELARPKWIRWSALAALVVAVSGAVFVAVDRSGQLERPWEVDEGGRVSEGYFWGLLIRGDLSHPDWFRNISDSSHPPANKYAFGIAMSLQGVPLPTDLSLERYYERLDRPYGLQPSPELETENAPRLQACRRAALFLNLLTGGVVACVLAVWLGMGAAIVAVILLARHYLFEMYLSSAQSHVLQAFALTATFPLVAIVWQRTKLGARAGLGVGLALGALSAVAYQVRLNGLLALGAAGLVCIVASWRTRSKVPLVVAFVMLLSTLAIGTGTNPFYWARAPKGIGIRPVYEANEPLPERIIARYSQQIKELEVLLDAQPERWHLREIPGRIRFVTGVLSSGKAGLAASLGVLALVWVALRGGEEERSRARLMLLWAGSLVAVFSVWVPLAWEGLCFLLLPPWILTGSFGIASATKLAWERLRKSGVERVETASS